LQFIFTIEIHSRQKFFQVLDLYKQLLRTRTKTFQGDSAKLEDTLARLRNDFRANKSLNDDAKIKNLIKIGKEVNSLLESSVLQTTKVKENIYRLNVKSYMLKDNHISKNNKNCN